MKGHVMSSDRLTVVRFRRLAQRTPCSRLPIRASANQAPGPSRALPDPCRLRKADDFAGDHVEHLRNARHLTGTLLVEYLLRRIDGGAARRRPTTQRVNDVAQGT